MSDFMEHVGTKREPRKAPSDLEKDGKLEPWMIPAAAAILAQGAPLQYAAEAINVGAPTVKKWIEEGKAEGASPIKRAFSEACVKARNDGNMANWRIIKDHALTDAKAAIHIARIADPETHTEKKELKIDGGLTLAPAVPVDEYEGLSLEEKRTLAEIRRKQLAHQRAKALGQ